MILENVPGITCVKGIFMKEKFKQLTTINKIHLLVIVLGILFSGASIFHSNLWFDESYSVGMAAHNWKEIWNIGGHDVHPVLYYWLLSFVGLISGESIIAYRVFSLICVSLTGFLGFTHIRKDFGNKVGILFSFFIFFIPATALFTGEIRMYSLALLLVTLCAIYGYRLYKGDTSWKNWIFFELTSLASLYTHYYGLMAVGLINVIMLFAFIKKHRSESIKRIILFGVLQFAIYVPWLIYFTSQLKQISTGFWIQFTFPDTIYEIACFQFRGSLTINYWLIGIVLCLYLYVIVKMVLLKIKKTEILPAVVSLGLYILVIIAAAVVKEVLHTSILLDRYFYVVTGLYVFGLSYILAKERKYTVIASMCIITLALSIISNITVIRNNYASNNGEQIKYIKENIQDEDSIVYTDAMSGSVIGIYFPKNQQYFFNEEDWGVEEAYKAFGDNYHTEVTDDFIKNLSGRIWIIDGSNNYCYNTYFNNDEYNIISQKEYTTTYHDLKYLITLVEKK